MDNRPPKDSAIINVCIIPEDTIGNKCVDLSQTLQSDATMFVLDGQSKFAHMTLFMARFSNDQINNVLNAVESALKNFSSFACEQTGYFMTAGRYVEVSYNKSKELMDLHKVLIQHLKNYRVNPGEPFAESYFTPYNEEQQKNARETGYDLAHDLFRPHITLTRYKEGMAPKHIPDFPPSNLSFQTNKICIYEADDNGAIYKKLAEFII
jgi:2'-5' RNA ligase